MTSCVLSSCFESLHIYHGFCHTHPLGYFSHVKPLNIMSDFFDLLSEFMYDGEGKVA